MIKNHLFQLFKKDYIKGKRPDVECILCAMINNDPKVESLIVYKNELITVCINLFPYNSGHLMIFPNRCIKDIRQLTKEEADAIHEWSKTMLTILDKIYSPKGYNMGYNLGEASGASIKHIHQHIIPRYYGELGMIDLIGGAKIMIEDPKDTLKKLKEEVATYLAQR